MSTYTELLTIKDRFEVFLAKLIERACELEQDALSMVQSAYDEDNDPYKRSYLNFKAGIEGQYSNLRQKVNDVFEQQIFARREALQSMDKDWEQFNNLYSEIYKAKEAFIDLMYEMPKRIFNSVKKISAETQLNEALAEYEEIKNAFCCTQCGGNLEIKEIYFVSTYIECEYCQTQNTFTPSSKMQGLHFLAKEVGEERHKDLKEIADTLSENPFSLDYYWAYFQYRAFVWLESIKITPVLKTDNLEVFYRELNDIIQHYDKDSFFENQRTYEKLLGLLDFKSVQKITSVKDKKLLNELAVFFIKKLGHFDKYQSIYEERLQRLEK